MGTGGGLNCMREGRVVSYPFEKTLSEEIVYSIYEDEEFNLWIGTSSGGLKKANEKILRTYSSKDGLFSNRIFSILEDRRGSLWMSCGKGIFSVGKKDLDDFDSGKIKKIPVKTYNEFDGMKTRECHGTDSQVACKTKEGKLWFATHKGLSMIDPSHVKINKYPPAVLIENVVIGGKVLSPHQEIKISRGVKNIAFRFNAISLTAPQKVKFKYKLEGLEDEWNYLKSSEERTVHYGGLSPGQYQFRLNASNNDNIWNDKETVYKFQLRPYFHQTFGFYLLCFCLVGVIGYGSWKIYRLKIRIKELKKYKSSSLQTIKAKEYRGKLIYGMEEKKYFTDREMTLHKLGTLLSIPSAHLSQIINVHFKQNFYDFLNHYRVEEAKKKLMDPTYKHYKLSAIGNEVGFKSTSTFYNAFKKYVRMTPLDFKNNCGNKENC